MPYDAQQPVRNIVNPPAHLWRNYAIVVMIGFVAGFLAALMMLAGR